MPPLSGEKPPHASRRADSARCMDRAGQTKKSNANRNAIAMIKQCTDVLSEAFIIQGKAS